MFHKTELSKTCLNFGVNRVLFMEVTLLRPHMLHKKATRDVRKSPEHVTEAANPSVVLRRVPTCSELKGTNRK